MEPPDVTNAPAEWVKIRGGNYPLWKNLSFSDVYSIDGGVTFTIRSEREEQDREREVRTSRVV